MDKDKLKKHVKSILEGYCCIEINITNFEVHPMWEWSLEQNDWVFLSNFLEIQLIKDKELCEKIKEGNLHLSNFLEIYIGIPNKIDFFENYQ